MSIKDNDSVKVVGIAPVSYTDGVVRFAVDIFIGPNRVSDAERGPGDAARLIEALTKLRPLEPGDEVLEYGAPQPRPGVVLKQSKTRAAWQERVTPYDVLISERSRMQRVEEKG